MVPPIHEEEQSLHSEPHNCRATTSQRLDGEKERVSRIHKDANIGGKIQFKTDC